MTPNSDAYDFSAEYAQLERLFTFVHRLTLTPEHLTLQISHYSSEIQTQITVEGIRDFQLQVVDAEEMLDFPLDIIRFRILPDEQRIFMFTTACEVTASFRQVMFEQFESPRMLTSLDVELTARTSGGKEA